jgi:hypothetical protein
VRPDIEVKLRAEDPAEGYDTMDQKLTTRAPNTGLSFVDDRLNIWYIMSYILGKHSCFVYIKPDLRTRNGREAYMLLFDRYQAHWDPVQWLREEINLRNLCTDSH